MQRRILVVVPCFNEAGRLRADLFRRHVLDHPDTGFLFVDDGSTDSTRDILTDLEAADPQSFGVLSLPRNQGKAEAVRQGVRRSIALGAEIVAYWDADLATPLQELRGMLGLLDANSAVQGVLASRVKLLGRTIERNPFRHYFGRVFATAASLVLQLPVYDTQCGAKVFLVTDDLEAVFLEPFRSGWIFDVELIGRLKTRWGRDADGRLMEYPVGEWVDVSGSKVRPHDFLLAVLDLFKIWRELRRGTPSGAGSPSPKSPSPKQNQRITP